MITLFLSSTVLPDEIYRILGIILTVIECCMIAVRLIYAFTPKNSKFANFLEFVFKGLKDSKSIVNNPKSDDLENKDDENV